MQMVIYPPFVQSIRVLSECDYICLVDCYSISATASIFHFPSSVVTLVYIYFIMIKLRWFDR